MRQSVGFSTQGGLVGTEFEVAPPRPGELPAFVTPTTAGHVRILPGLLEREGGLDGFFIARLVRRG